MGATIKQILLVRHGESETNRTDIYQSGDQFENDPLSEIGRLQAQRLGAAFGGATFQPQVILSSAYRRAYQTAEAIAQATGLNICIPVSDERGRVRDLSYGHAAVRDRASLLRELDEPSELAGRRFDDPVAVAIKEDIRAHAYEGKWHYDDEENRYDSWRRAGQCLEYLALRSEERLVTVCHGGLIKACLAHILFAPRGDWSLDQKVDAYQSFFGPNTWVDNTAIFSLLYYPEDARWQWIMGYNAHLGGDFGFMPSLIDGHLQDVSVDNLQSNGGSPAAT